MNQGRRGGVGPWLVTLAVTLATAAATVGAVLAQDAPPAGRGKAAARARRGAPAPRPTKEVRKGAPGAADPFARANQGPLAKDAAPGTFHYRFRMQVPGEADLAASYYPSRLGTTAPVVLLIHEKDRMGKDFEEPIGDLKGLGLAEHLQGQGFAVLLLDLRGHGSNPRRALAARDWQAMTVDLQEAYLFLLDRHNRGELNLNRLGVVGVGEGAGLVAAWAATPGAAVSAEGRNSDLAALVLVSPVPIEGRPGFESILARLAPRVPMLLMVGERDAISGAALKAVRPFVERAKANKIELFPSSLHGYKLLWLEPKATSVLAKFLEGTLKFKSDEWEPRYNLAPVVFGGIELVRHAKSATSAKSKGSTPAKTKAEPKDAPAEKVKDAPADKKDAPG